MITVSIILKIKLRHENPQLAAVLLTALTNNLTYAIQNETLESPLVTSEPYTTDGTDRLITFRLKDTLPEVNVSSALRKDTGWCYGKFFLRYIEHLDVSCVSTYKGTSDIPSYDLDNWSMQVADIKSTRPQPMITWKPLFTPGINGYLSIYFSPVWRQPSLSISTKHSVIALMERALLEVCGTAFRPLRESGDCYHRAFRVYMDKMEDLLAYEKALMDTNWSYGTEFSEHILFVTVRVEVHEIKKSVPCPDLSSAQTPLTSEEITYNYPRRRLEVKERHNLR